VINLSDFDAPSFFSNPFPIYDALRAEGRFVTLGSNQFISGHYDIVSSLLQDRRMIHNFDGLMPKRFGEDALRQPVLRGYSRMLLLTNPPEHTRLRSLMMKAFNARMVESMREITSACAHRLIDDFEDRGSVDLLAAYAAPLPVEILCAMLDIPVEHAQKIGAAIEDIAGTFNISADYPRQLTTSNDAYLTLDEYFSEIIEARRNQCGSDLISILLTVEEHGEALTHEEIVANIILVILGGHESIANVICNSLIALQRHPHQFDALKQDLSRLPKAIMECLRYEGPARLSARIAGEDMEFAGVMVPSNSIIHLSLGAANRDPAKFSYPDQFDIDREAPRMLTFGAGVHHCLGYWLTLLELETALGVLLMRLPNIAVDGLDQLRWNCRGNLRGVDSLHVHW
jgi:cytochrome P450